MGLFTGVFSRKPDDPGGAWPRTGRRSGMRHANGKDQVWLSGQWKDVEGLERGQRDQIRRARRGLIYWG